MAEFDSVFSAGTTTQKKNLLHRVVEEVRCGFLAGPSRKCGSHTGAN